MRLILLARAFANGLRKYDAYQKNDHSHSYGFTYINT